MASAWFSQLLLCVIILPACVSFAGDEGTPKMDARKMYFESFDGYDLPLRLVTEITKEDAERRKAFLVAERGNDGRIWRIVKILDGKPTFKHEYRYFENGRLRSARVWNEEGTETINEYDENGRLLSRAKAN